MKKDIIHKMLRKLKPKSEFSKNSISLITGSTISQAIPAALSPILTRIYTPEEYGLLAVFMSVSGIFATLATAKYDMAIIMPKSDKEAANIILLSFLMTFLISLISLFIVHFLNNEIVDFLGKPEISNWLYFIPLTVILSGLHQSLSMWSTRKKRFKRISNNMILGTITASSMNLSFGLSNFGVLGLIFSTIIAQSITIWHLLIRSFKNDSSLIRYTNKLKIIKVMKKYKKMPLFIMPNTLIDNIRVTSLNILVIQFFTTAILGQLSLAFKVIRVPMTIIYSALIQVFMQKLAVSPKNDYYRLLSKFLSKTTLIGIPLYSFMYFVSPDAFAFVFGEQWRFAGEVGSILSIWMFFHIMTNPVGHFLILVNKQQILLLFSIFYVLIVFGIFFIFNTGEFLTTFMRMALTMSFFNSVLIIYSLILAKKLSK